MDTRKTRMPPFASRGLGMSFLLAGGLLDGGCLVNDRAAVSQVAPDSTLKSERIAMTKTQKATFGAG